MMAPIFIMSSPRSGSTLLRYLLDSHPSICCPAELRLGFVCQGVSQMMELTTDGARAFADQSDRSTHFTAVRGVVEGILLDYCRRKGKDIWCEKSPDNIDYLQLLCAVFPDARHICLHRHALDVARSSLAVDGPFSARSMVAKHPGNALAACVERWCVVTERLLALEGACQKRAVRVLYEDLVSDAEVTVKGVLEFLGLPAVPDLARVAFTAPHDRGPEDVRIRGFAAVTRERIGLGRQMSVSQLPTRLVSRMYDLLACVGYHDHHEPDR
jgi:protein-tyrosine sulfotransferase